MNRPDAWPVSVSASILFHVLIGLYIGNLTRAFLAGQSTDVGHPRFATPLDSLGFSLVTAVAVGCVLLIANLVAGRAVGWTQRWRFLMPPLSTAALIAASGFVGTWQYLRT